MSKPSISIEVQGLTRLLARLDGDRLLRKPIAKLASGLGKRGKDEARAIAPRATGKLLGSIGSRVSSRPVPTFVAIQTKARRGSVSYPKVLEYSPKYGHKGWLRDAMTALMGRIGPDLDQAARDIEREFGS